MNADADMAPTGQPDSAQLASLRLTADEWRHITALLGRRPNGVELAVFSVMWSEHCSYKSTRRHLPLLRRPAAGEVIGWGENAGGIGIGPDRDGHDWCAVFKVESHNHPSFLAPAQGAATGVGGIVRDVLAVGARPIALLNAIRCAPPMQPAHRQRLQGIVEGLSSYGNCIGVPTVGGQVRSHVRYGGNPLVNAFALGVVRSDRRISARPRGAGDVVLYLGAATGRDGIHGATMASGAFDGAATRQRPSVQIGDPLRAKLLIEACAALAEAGLLVAMQDMGAAGLTSSSCEVAARAGCGLELDLDVVPQTVGGLDATALLLSETQERMLAVVDERSVDEVLAIVARWGLRGAVLGRLDSSGRWRARHRGEVVADVPIGALAGGAPEPDRPYAAPPQPQAPAGLSADRGPGTLPALLDSLDLGDKQPIWQQFDHGVQAATVAGPGDAEAAVVRVPENGALLALSLTACERVGLQAPWLVGAAAVAHATRKLACAGAVPRGLTDCLNFGTPQSPAVMWTLVEAMRGIGDASEALRCPVVSGNVSLYNTTGEVSVLPTAVVCAVGQFPAAARPCPNHWQQVGDIVWLAGDFRPGRGTALAWSPPSDDPLGTAMPLDLNAEADLQAWLAMAHRHGWLTSARSLADGGLAVAVAQSSLGQAGLGCRLELPRASTADDTATLAYGEGGGSVVVTAAPGLDLAELAAGSRVPLQRLGSVTEDGVVMLGPWQWPLQVLRQAWQGGVAARLYPAAESPPAGGC